MAELEELAILIDVMGDFETELNHLLFKLGQVETATRAVDDITIDVDVDGQHELDTLVGQLAMLQSTDLADVGDIVLGEKSVTRGGGGGGIGYRGEQAMKEQTQSLERMLASLDASLNKTLDDLNTKGRRASGSMDHLGSEARDVGDRLTELDLRMTDVHNALARLVPMILTVIGAVPALIGAFVTLAAAAVAAALALGSLTAFGALGAAAARGGRNNIGAGFTEIMREIRRDFLDAFLPLARDLAPLFEDAVDGLGDLFDAVAARGDSLKALADDARDVGGFIFNTLPSFLDELARFADAASDTLAIFVQMGAEVDWFGAFASYLANVLPAFTDFVTLLMGLVPVVFRISIGFLQATNGLLSLVTAMAQMLNVLPISEQMFGSLVGSMLAAYGVALLLNTAFVSMAGRALVSVGTAVLGVIQSLTGLSVSEWIAARSTYALAASFVALAGAIALTGIGALLVAVGGIAQGFLSTSNSIDQATNSLKEFQRQQSKMDSGQNPYANPNVPRGSATGRSRFSGSSVSVTVEGDADDETVRNQSKNAMYRMERPGRSR